MSGTVHLGFAVGSGEAVSIPVRNMAVTGQTQESGKTTTLEALVQRAGATALAFVTKRGEGSFSSGHRVAPYFRDRADWQFVTSIIDATLQEKNKFLRPWIIKICRTTKTLADVQREVRQALKKATGVNEGVYTQLDAYLDLIVPEIARIPMTRGLDLRPGAINVMDLAAYSTPMQMLFVQSALDWVNANERETIVVVPEAWEFIPEGKGSPVKDSAVTLVRKGSGIGNRIWVDSQDMAGVDKVILRGCPVWLIGVQREANEIKRNLNNIPAGIQRPKPGDIAQLQRGQFYACFADRTVKVYVQPAWMDSIEARAVALGDHSIPNPPKRTEDTVNQAEAKRLSDENDRLTRENADLRRRLDQIESQTVQQSLTSDAAAKRVDRAIPLQQSFDNEELYQAIKNRLIDELPTDSRVMQIVLARPELRVEVQRHVIEASGDTLFGRLAVLISEGFFDETKAGNAAYVELQRRGFSTAKPNVYREADKLASKGFLTKEDGGYRAVSGMKVNIVERD